MDEPLMQPTSESFDPPTKQRRIGRALLVYLAVTWTLVAAGLSAIVQLSYLDRISSDTSTTPIKSTAIILGASVLQNKTPSDALRDRLLTGIKLYQDGAVQKLLITGDDGSYRVDEIDVMKTFVLDHGVREQDLLIDGHGYRTYESCKRAAQAFSVTDAIIVTQRFHIGRALYLCNHLGIDAIGVTSDLQPYQRNAYFWTRDLLSSVKAWIDINVFSPTPPV